MNHQEDNIKFANYVVVFIDLLGQTEHLLKYKLLPYPFNQEEKEAFTNVLKQTYGSVLKLRKSYEDYYSGYNANILMPNDANIPDDKKEEYHQIRKTDICSQYFNDGMIFYSALTNQTNNVLMNNVWGMITSAASLCLVQLALKRPIRGGIDIGWGGLLKEGELYGNSVASAYILESKIAKYPRIVVSNETVEYLQAIQNQHRTAERNICVTVNKKIATRCLKVISSDDDGHFFLDYLGEEFQASVCGQVEEYEKNMLLIRHAYAYIEKQLIDNQSQKNPHEAKMFQRYSRLHNYFNKRLPIWGIDPSANNSLI